MVQNKSSDVLREPIGKDSGDKIKVKKKKKDSGDRDHIRKQERWKLC